MQLPPARKPGLALRVLLALLGLAGLFVSMALAFLIFFVSQEDPSTKPGWGFLCALIFGSSILCLLPLLRPSGPSRRHARRWS